MVENTRQPPQDEIEYAVVRARIPLDLKQSLQVKAITNRTTQQAIIEDLIRKYVEKDDDSAEKAK